MLSAGTWIQTVLGVFCTPWDGVEAFQESEVSYLMSPFRHTSHTPVLITESYTLHTLPVYTRTHCAHPLHTHTPQQIHTLDIDKAAETHN